MKTTESNNHSSILTEQELETVNLLFEKLRHSSKNLEKIIEPLATKIATNWEMSQDVQQAQKILNEFALKSLNAANRDTAKKIITVMGVINTCSLVFWKAATYEIMSEKYTIEIRELKDHVIKLENENKNLKINLEK